MKCQETYSVMERRLELDDMNYHHTFFGGQIASDLDMVSSIASSKFCHAKTVTAAFDHIDFHAPAHEGDIIQCQAFVTGKGTRSFEVFSKITATDALHQNPRLIATAFMTFVLLEPQELPDIQPVTDLEQLLCETYETRRQLSSQYKPFIKKDLLC